MNEKELSPSARDLLMRIARASKCSPVGAAMIVGNTRGESRVIPQPADGTTDVEIEAMIDLAFSVPESDYLQ